MRAFWIGCFGAVLMVWSGRTQPTPMDAPLAEETPVTIDCELKRMPGVSEMKHLTRFKERQAVMGAFQYQVRLPRGFHEAPAKSWPSMFIVAPEDHARLEAVQAWLSTNGFVTVVLLNARQGDLAPAIGNFLSAHDDAVKRLRLKDGEKWMIGVEEVGRRASLFVQYRPGFRGLLLLNTLAFRGAGNKPDLEGLRRNSTIRIASLYDYMGGSLRDDWLIGKAINAPERSRSFEYWESIDGDFTKAFDRATAWILGRPVSERPATP